MVPENQEINLLDVPIEENLSNEDIKAILILLQQKIESDDLKEEQLNKDLEQQKQEKIEADKAQKILDEQNEQIQLEEKQFIEKKEQELIDAEIEFRENLLSALNETNLKLDEVITYNSKSDGFSEKITLVSEKIDLLIENTGYTEIQETNANLASYADVAIIGLVVIVLPIYVVYRFLKSILSPLL